MKSKEKEYYKIIKSLDTAFTINDIYKKAKFKDEYFYYSDEKNDFHIINVVFSDKSFNPSEQYISKIRKKIQKNQYLDKINVLVIVFAKVTTEIVNNKNFSIIYLNINNWKKDITKIIPDINFDSEFNIMKAIEESQNGRLLDSNSSIAKKQNSFLHKKRITNLPIFLSLLVITIIIPVILNIFWFLIIQNMDDASFKTTTTYEIELIFGAANHDLIIGLNQWWRIFMFPISSYGFMSIFLHFLILMFFVRYMEINIGKFKGFILICLYPFIAIIMTMTSYYYVLAGPSILYALLIGAGFVSSYKKSDYSSLMIKRSAVFLMVLCVLFSLFYIDLINDLTIIFSFIIGSVYGLFINHNYRRKDWLLYIPIIIFVLFSLLVIIFIVLEETTRIIPPLNEDVINAMEIYMHHHLISSSAYEKLLNSYYHQSV